MVVSGWCNAGDRTTTKLIFTSNVTTEHSLVVGSHTWYQFSRYRLHTTHSPIAKSVAGIHKIPGTYPWNGCVAPFGVKLTLDAPEINVKLNRSRSGTLYAVRSAVSVLYDNPVTSYFRTMYGPSAIVAEVPGLSSSYFDIPRCIDW